MTGLSGIACRWQFLCDAALLTAALCAWAGRARRRRPALRVGSGGQPRIGRSASVAAAEEDAVQPQRSRRLVQHLTLKTARPRACSQTSSEGRLIPSSVYPERWHDHRRADDPRRGLGCRPFSTFAQPGRYTCLGKLNAWSTHDEPSSLAGPIHDRLSDPDRAPSPRPPADRSPQQHRWSLSPPMARSSPAIREDIMALRDSVAPGATARPELQQAAEWCARAVKRRDRLRPSPPVIPIREHTCQSVLDGPPGSFPYVEPIRVIEPKQAD